MIWKMCSIWMKRVSEFRALLDSTLSHVKQSCKGGKQGKDQTIVVLTCSALGEKLLPWIISKSKNPRPFWGQDMSKLKVKHTKSAKAWMTNPIFNQYLKELDEYFKRKGCKIVFFWITLQCMLLMRTPIWRMLNCAIFRQIWPQFSSPLTLASFEI